MAYLYDLTDTWNAAGTVFNAIRMNVTNSASAAGSKIVSLQVGSTDKFTVDKDGNGYFSGTLQAVGSISTPNLYIGANSGTIGMQDNTASILAYNGTGSGGITNTLRFITGASERVRIDTSGNVGIGTSSPLTRLHVDIPSTTQNYALIGNASNGIGVGVQADGSPTIFNYANKGIIFAGNYNTSLTEQMRIDSSGNVGIGTSSPGAKLDVNGQTNFRSAINLLTGSQAYFYNPAGNAYSAIAMDSSNVLGITNTAGSALTLGTNNTERMRIDSSGNVGIGGASPYSRLFVTSSGTTTVAVESTGATSTLRGFAVAAGSTEYATFKQRLDSGELQITSGLAGWGGFTTFHTNGSERMRINSSGNVGIGTSSPASKLEVKGAGFVAASISGDSTSETQLRFNTNTAARVSQQANQALIFDTNATERMRIDTSGNVGIGTSSPVDRLNVSDGTATFQFKPLGGSSIGYMGMRTNHALGFTTNDTERARIDSSGNLLVNTTSANGKLSVVGDQISITSGAGPDTLGLQLKGTALSAIPAAQVQGYIATGDSTIGTAGDLLIAPRTSVTASVRFITGTTPAERMRIDSSGNLLVGTTTSSLSDANAIGVSPTTLSGLIAISHATGSSTGNGYALFGYAGTQIGSISQSGTTAVVYSTTSDVRLKENVADADDAASLIDAIKVRKFDWKTDGSHQRYGFVAQELIEVAPEAVSKPEDEDAMMGVDYSKLVPMLVKEIQSLRARVAQLEGN